MKTVRLPRTRSRISEANEFRPRTVLVPVDFSTLSTIALDKARQIAQQFGSKIRLIHVIEPIARDVECILVPPEMGQMNQRLFAERKARLESLRRDITSTGTDAQGETRFGTPWRVIVHYATRTKSDLLVISTHGYTGPKHLLMGSTAERVVQHAPCSVLVVR
jgi:universal stress protein A